MSAAIAIVAMVAVAVASLGALYAARAQAQAGADAAALAAAVASYPPAGNGSPLSAARVGAGENGAVVVRCSCRRDSSMRARVVEVVTGVTADVPLFGEWIVHASSRAEFDPLRWLGRTR